MKKLIKILLLSSLVFSLVSCGSTKVEEKNIENTEIEVVDENVVVDEAEYIRSTKTMNGESVSKGQFVKDKAEILRIINEIELAMKNKDVNGWIEYVAPTSVDYFSKPRKFFSNQGLLVTNGIDDVFFKVFIPARNRGEVSEIRYISPTLIKAVEITKNGYSTWYNFEKINDVWYVVLPTDIVAE